MIIDILILAAVSVVLYLILPFISDLISLPFNAFTINRLKHDAQFGIHFQPKWFDLVLVFLAFSFFTYLFSGICASYLSWMSEKHPDSFFAKSIAVALGSVTASSFSRKSGKISQQEPLMSNLPSILAGMFVHVGVYIMCVLFLAIPKLIEYWSWMPYVK